MPYAAPAEKKKQGDEFVSHTLFVETLNTLNKMARAVSAPEPVLVADAKAPKQVQEQHLRQFTLPHDDLDAGKKKIGIAADDGSSTVLGKIYSAFYTGEKKDDMGSFG